MNGILVGEQTQRATREVIEYREAEAVIAKGKSEPSPYGRPCRRARASASTSASTAARRSSVASAIDALTSTLERVKQEREPQLVTLVGVPGIGKAASSGNSSVRSSAARH